MKDCRGYVEEGIYESEVCGDSSMLAQFLMQKALLNLLEGVNLLDTIPVLQVISLLVFNIKDWIISTRTEYDTFNSWVVLDTPCCVMTEVQGFLTLESTYGKLCIIL